MLEQKGVNQKVNRLEGQGSSDDGQRNFTNTVGIFGLLNALEKVLG